MQDAPSTSFEKPQAATAYFRKESVENAARSIRHIGDVRREVISAFNEWQRASPLHFTEVPTEASADIRVSFATGDHGDPYRFDGTGRILAHAFPPGEGLGGDIHLDDDEHWTSALTGDPHSQQVSLRSIVLHELGHSLGLSHSQQEDSIMYAFYQYDLPPSLSYDDILAVQTVYGGVPFDPTNQRPKLTVTTTTERPTLPTEEFVPRRPPKIDEPELPIAEPDPCASGYDAIAIIRQEIFVFKDQWFWRIQANGHLNQAPRQIQTFWNSLTGPIDAAAECDEKIYFFVGKYFFVYDGQKLQFRSSLTTLGLPKYVERIRLVYTWNYWTEKPMYLWTDEEFWRVDKRSGKVEIGYPRKIAGTWHGVPKEASAAVTYNDDLYFFAENRAYKFYSINMSVAEPISTTKLWRFCPIAAQISCSATADAYARIPSPNSARALIIYLLLSLFK